MGDYAESVDTDFTVPTANIPAALAAVNEKIGEYDTLAEAVESCTSFQNNEEDETGFHLGYHNDKYGSWTEDVLKALAPFATEGSYVRFSDIESLWGFRVIAGQLKGESGNYAWTDGEKPPTTVPVRVGILLTRDQLEAWAGRPLSDEHVARLGNAIQYSTIPDAVGDIVCSWDD